ncbi:MupA/Atu3671 family FMN-dependent luciferase-like monooxygenase [Sandaracinus amylolyticus]|uniref:MupA/Atu3671 family FMN-dependent luciferase-like monooxygenase n=1 Tax=Sandaracinus amylolyticus TaxID=927083 RepID=UPI001F2F9B6A|nr:MupA/Atu3671 family FMN-dependent luciferase-like monooxygenase [Sandaracinus amylolyticus]UJR87060.1 Hypothetical protein I5071_91610 [Sandaracinus amylolyticus]
MHERRPLAFLVLGAQSLTVQCGEMLLARGHTIPALVTDAPDVRAWAEQRALRVVAPGRDLASRLESIEVDWILSAANLRIVPDDVLAKAKHGAINFHDGPLPRYAGLHATSWALIAGERTHGVTWHLIEGGVDEGRICAQREIEIAEDETAFTLDAKCFAAGIDTFREMLGAIEDGTLAPRAQDLSRRTYFARHDRPAAVATIDWSRPAREVLALVRALDFGSYENPLAIAKTRLGDRVLLVRAAKVVERGGARPGEVLEVGEDGVVVACGDGAIAITSIADADGGPITIAAGACLESLDAATSDRLSAMHRELCGHERWWAARLRAPAPVLPQASDAQHPAPRMLATSGDGDAVAASLAVALARIGDLDATRIGWTDAALAERVRGVEGWFADVIPLRVVIDDETTVASALGQVQSELAAMRDEGTFARDLRARTRSERDAVVIVRHAQLPETLDARGALLTLHVSDDGRVGVVRDGAVCPQGIASLETLLATIAREPERRVRSLSLLSDDERTRLLVDLNRSAVETREACLQRLFEEQVDRTPDAIALAFEDETLTYRALDARANALAHRLRTLGVGPERLVAVAVERSIELVVAVLGVLKAGGAYLPLDPAFPRDRVAMMLEDSGAQVVVTQRSLAPRFSHVTTVRVDELRDITSRTRIGDVDARPEHLAYVLYTSGSTGRPKGVMVEHRQVANFFVGMDARIAHDPPGVWLAVTSLSFDISVLELLWTLSRGFRVVVHRDRDRERDDEPRAAPAPIVPPEIAAKPMDFGLCYWGNDDREGKGKYELLLEGARFADANGFHAVWTPERHFHAFGGPFPNPSVSGAAVAAITKNVHVRAASVVLPLHHPLRVAEEWAMIDNLTEGRVGLGIASGWQPDDFVLRPENTPPAAKDAMFRDIEVLRRVWRGERVAFARKDGSLHEVVSQPRPVQRDLPIWLTIALNPESYRQAADIGANVLTHLLGQSIEELAGKIRIYRDRLAELGRDPASGKVTLMLHTFVAPDREIAREATREPLKKYLASAASLIKQYVWMFPALKRPHGASHPDNIDLATLDAEEIDAVLEYAFHRYFEESGLLGSVDDCVARVQQLKALGVDEIACLIDFGVETKTVLASLPHLAEVVRRTARPEPPIATEHPFARDVARHAVTHLQCTPSMARMLLLDDASRAALGRVKHLMIGGEALPSTLVHELRRAGVEHIENMYGPTETTIWSSTDTVRDEITLGTPIANTTFYVLDERRRLVPLGASGELWIGGRGVARGYLHRAELTSERFVRDPFSSDPDARIYRTGDRVRWRANGRLEFLGRVDHQVKVRGYRIELGEIEAALATCEGVREAVVIARAGTGGDAELVAYVTAHPPVDAKTMREHLRATLPSYMVPSRFVALERFPLTPNKKVDRNALPAPDDATTSAPEATSAPPANDLERDVAAIWREVLGVAEVGRDDNFFELGGHSLLAVRLHRRLVEAIGKPIAMTDVFRFPTVRAFAAQLGGTAQPDAQLDAVASRAAARRAARARR